MRRCTGVFEVLSQDIMLFFGYGSMLLIITTV